MAQKQKKGIHKITPTQYGSPSITQGLGFAPVPTPPIFKPVVPQPVPNQLKRGIGLANVLRLLRTTLKGYFSVFALIILILALIQAYFNYSTYNQAYADLQDIKANSVPSVDAAQTIGQYVEDIDAKAADYLATAALTDSQHCNFNGQDYKINGKDPTVHECDNWSIDRETAQLNEQIYQAAKNVTFPGEHTAVHNILTGMAQYNGYLSIMRHEYDLAGRKDDPTDEHLIKARKAYQAATKVLHDKIEPQSMLTTLEGGTPPFCSLNVNGNNINITDWPTRGVADNATCLSHINYNHLTTSYENAKGYFTSSLIFAIITGLLLILALLFTTLRMSMITHRFFNIGLGLATITGVIFSVTIMTSYINIDAAKGTVSFQQAVKDDYDSVYYMAQLKRYGTMANADESRWLIAKEFNDPKEAEKWQNDWTINNTLMSNLFKREDVNVTSDKEGSKNVEMKNDWNGYQGIDATIRAAANGTKDKPGDITLAEKISTGESNLKFSQFSDRADDIGTINRNDFDNVNNAAEDLITRNRLFSAILFPLVGIAAVAGVFMRLKDF